MGSTQSFEKVEEAKRIEIDGKKMDLEDEFNKAVKETDQEAWEDFRKLFIDRLAKILLDKEPGVSEDFLKVCNLILAPEEKAQEETAKLKERGENDTESNIEKNYQAQFKGILIQVMDKGMQKIQKEANFEAENQNKKKEDQTFNKTKQYFGQHMNAVRAVSNVGKDAVKATSGLASALSRTAKLAGGFSIIGLTLTYLGSGIFDDEGTKMKKMTEKMANTLRKEVDLKLYEQCMDDLSAIIASVNKLVDVFHQEPIDLRESEIDRKEKAQLMLTLLHGCDVIFEKIGQKKVYFKNALYFLQFFYFYARIHIDLIKLGITRYGVRSFNNLKEYIAGYRFLFNEYLAEAKRQRMDCFQKKVSLSSFNTFTKIVANQYKIYESLVDNFNSETIISYERTRTYNESVSGNVYANFSTLYHEIAKYKPNLYDIDFMLPKLKEAIGKELNIKYRDIEVTFEKYLTRSESHLEIHGEIINLKKMSDDNIAVNAQKKK